jgi:site-specific DNA-methyltransferase (adenine-specific)
MKPLEGNFAQNAVKHGVAGLNIDGTRIGFVSDADKHESQDKQARKPIGGFSSVEGTLYGSSKGVGWIDNSAGRFPANVLHDGSEEVVSQFPITLPAHAGMRGKLHGNIYGGGKGPSGPNSSRGHNDVGGSASRFFKEIIGFEI